MERLLRALQDLGKSPERLLISRALNNGNAEKLLAHCLLASLENITGGSGVLDKQRDRHQVDLVLFLRQHALLTVELKCTFSSDRTACVRAAQDAYGKALVNDAIFAATGAGQFIVHFLNHADPRSRSDHLPAWILRKYPKGELMTSADISRLYKNMDKNFSTQTVSCVTRRGAPLLEAVVVKL